MPENKTAEEPPKTPPAIAGYRVDKENEYSRIIFRDDKGKELEFQRGKSFLVLTSSYCVVTYQ